MDVSRPHHDPLVRKPKGVRPCLGLTLSIALFSAIAGCAMQPTQFDSAAWKAQRGVDEAEMTRVGMVSRLENVLRPGMTREEVLERLGPPDDSTSDGSVDTYLLGIGFSPDPQYYRLTYQGGRLISHEHVMH